MASRRLTARDGLLLIVDVQEKLVPSIRGGREVVDAIARLARGASLLGVPALATEQYRQGLGATIVPIAELVDDRHEKLTFHAMGALGLVARLGKGDIRHVAIAGVEAHICVAQTALELIDRGYVVQVVADAVGSHEPTDRDVALDRLRAAGAVISTVEAVLFEWAESAEHPAFKALGTLVKEGRGPANRGIQT